MEVPAYIYTAVVVAIDWIIRITLLFYVPRRRKPTAATAWLLAIFVLPGIIGLALYFVIGSTRPSKLRRQRLATVNKAILDSQHVADASIQYPERIQPFITLSRNLSKFPAVNGNTNTLHTDYKDTIIRITRDVKKAKHYIYIESYILALDDITEPLFVAMEQAARRGVSVYVLFDSYGSHKYRYHRQMRRRLRDSGIKWCEMLPISLVPRKYSRPDLRNHRKLIAIDNTVAYIGSLNLIEPRYGRKDDIIYEELVTRMKGPIVAHTAAIIAGDWYTETGQAILHFNELESPTTYSHLKGGQLMQIVPSGPAYKNENNLKLFIDMIYSAKRRIVITNPYLVPTEPLLMALITAAQRGVNVVVINSEAIDQRVVGHAQRSYYGQLLEAGVHIYLHHAPVLLHAKHMTIDDDIAMIGSSNMDVRSFELNYECSLMIYDPRIVARLTDIQARNLAQSSVLTKEAWSKRHVKDILLDNIARLTSALQ